MPPVTTPAIVLATLRYGETSKIARLATRELGIQSAIAKGAMRPRSRIGASLHLVSEGEATLHLSRSSDLHLLVQFDPRHVRIGLARQMDRYAAAGLLSELMLRFAPPAAHAQSYDLFRDALALLEAAPDETVEAVALRAAWRLVASLGFAPSLEACARDGVPVPADRPACFSPRDGGVLCDACARGTVGATLPPGDRADLAAFLTPGRDLPLPDARHLAAHRRLLERYLRFHLAGDVPLPALSFWIARGWIAA
jgi:DNA repair protein RecO (recombination protein O)